MNKQEKKFGYRVSEAEVNLNLNSDGIAVNLSGKVATMWGNLKGSR